MREHARYLQVAYGSSERRVCGVLTFGRSTCRYESVAAEQAPLRMRIRDLAASRVSYGYRRIHVLLRREGWKVNHKRVYRLYRLEGLRMRPKRPRRHVSGRRRETRAAAARPDERWAMDFMSDELFDGRRIRVLTIVDHFSRESPAILVDGSLGGRRVVEALTLLAQQGRKPRTIAMDNGPEFTSRALDQWAYLNGVELDFSRPGKPTDNAIVEAFNARLRAECLERELVPVVGRCPGEDRGLAEVLQWRTAPRRPGESRPGNLRPEDPGGCWMSRETNTAVGTENGAGRCRWGWDPGWWRYGRTQTGWRCIRGRTGVDRG